MPVRDDSEFLSTPGFLKLKLEVGEVIRTLRLRKNVSQAELAKMCKVNQSMISRLERGKVEDYSLARLCSIANILGMDVDVVFSPPTASEPAV
jgi:transcriptional regulator with XRE-family HTH domain